MISPRWRIKLSRKAKSSVFFIFPVQAVNGSPNTSLTSGLSQRRLSSRLRYVRSHEVKCLNPYCSGQWSRARPYKTSLIINKLKSFTQQILTFLNQKSYFFAGAKLRLFFEICKPIFLKCLAIFSQKNLTPLTKT